MINNKFFDLDTGFIRNDISIPTEHGIRNLYFVEHELHQSVYKVIYYQNNILLQHLYQCGFKTLTWRIFYWTQKSCYTYNIDDYTGDKIPLWLLDDENLIKANYKKKSWTL